MTDAQQVGQLRGKLKIAGTLNYRNAAGEIVGSTEIHGEIPLDRLTEAQRAELLKDATHGSDRR
jgi:hypothetical protein